MRGAVATSWTAFEREGTDRAVLHRGPAGLSLLTAVLVLVALAVVGTRSAGLEPLTVLSGSMAPAIDRGDLVLVARVPAAEARPGQVITFRSPDGRDRSITHRVMSVRQDPTGRLAFVTKGDANPAPERWTIPVDGTVGRVRATVPYAGFLAQPIAAGAGRGIALGLLTLVAAGTVLWLIWRPSS